MTDNNKESAGMINSFTGKYRFLSNFWSGPGLASRLWNYPTMENYFQAMKTRDMGERQGIRECRSPGQAKKLGRLIALRPDWEDIKLEVMLVGLRRKFAPDTQLAKCLLETGGQFLVEGNYWHDNYWGNCNCHRCADIIPGINLLGTLLMQVRDELSNNQKEV